MRPDRILLTLLFLGFIALPLSIIAYQLSIIASIIVLSLSTALFIYFVSREEKSVRGELREVMSGFVSVRRGEREDDE